METSVKSDVYVRAALAALFCIVASGCATTRSEIKLASPIVVAASPAPSAGRTAVIRSVKDERVFAESPSDPSTPSLGLEGATNASAEVKARAVGRKRNAYGKALGDLQLESGQTVESVIRDNTSVALKQAGYDVKANLADAGTSPLIIDIHVKEFWAWLRPGFWAITLNSKIATDFDISGAMAPVQVSGVAEQKTAMAIDSVWMEVIDTALKDFRAQVASKLAVKP